MGRCEICNERIQYNRYKKIDDKIYCLKCAAELEEKCLPAEELDFAEEKAKYEAKQKVIKTEETPDYQKIVWDSIEKDSKETAKEKKPKKKRSKNRDEKNGKRKNY